MYSVYLASISYSVDRRWSWDCTWWYFHLYCYRQFQLYWCQWQRQVFIGLGSVRLWAYQLHQRGFCSCYSEADGKSAKSFNVVKMSPTDDSSATGQTGSHDRLDRSSSDRPPEPTGQTGPTQSGSSSALSTIGRVRTICAKLLKNQKIWTSWVKVLCRLIL